MMQLHTGSEVTLGLLRAAVDKLARQENAKNFLIDGFPRETEQAIAFEKAVRLAHY